jgi:tRNA(Ile)-lysidine synthase
VARPRSGGERFCLAPQGVPRSLKQQYQARAVPAWDRGGPLLFSPAGRLVYAPALGFDARFVCEPGQPQLQLIWVPATTGG